MGMQVADARLIAKLNPPVAVVGQHWGNQQQQHQHQQHSAAAAAAPHDWERQGALVKRALVKSSSDTIFDNIQSVTLELVDGF